MGGMNMIAIGALLCIVIIVLTTLFYGSIYGIIDMPSLFLVLGINVAIIIGTGSIKDFLYGLKLCVSKNTTPDKNKLSNSIRLFRLLFKTSIGSGFIGLLIGFISLFSSLSDPASIGPHSSISLISVLYGLVLAFGVISPIIFVLERFLHNISSQEI